ncbi:MAG TPA: hypothetical protein DCR20_03330 [Planctomycetaceae bacterium]|nr:hypothetical protein [Planctomycetaceae bacterium]
MSTPFTFFRRHQQITMVSIVILSMVAFTISDMMSNQANHFVMLGVLLGGIIMGFSGIRQGRWLQYGIGGAIFGGLVGWLMPGTVASSDGFYQESAIGAFDDQRIQETATRRSICNAFMAQAFSKVYGPGTERFAPQFRYYTTLQEDAIFGELLKAEADAMQIVVTDEMVSDFINQSVDGRLSGKAFAEIRTGLNVGGLAVSEDQLYDAFRHEIAARLAFTQLSPSSAAVAQPPGLYYDMFRRTQVRQRLNAVRLDVDAFLSKVPDPSPAEIEAAFAQYSKKFPGMDGPGSPGFRQFNKAALAYLELSWKSAQDAAPAPTDAEIEAFYNEKKDTFYRKEPDEKPADEPATPGAAPTDPAAPATPEPTSPAPEAPKADAPAAPPADAPAGDAPKSEPAPEAPAQPAPPADPAPAPAADSPKPDGSCLPAADETAKPAEAAPAQEQPAAAPAPAQTETPPTTPETTPAEPAPAPADAAAQAPAAGTDPVPFVIPPVEYRPLDDELKSEIREQLHEERIRKAIDEKMDAVMSGLREIERKRSAARRQVVDKDPSLTSEQIATAMKDVHQSLLDEMRELGEKLGLRFVRTGLLNRVDLAADDQTPLGLALGYTSGAPVADEVFSKFPQRDQWEDANLFASDRAVRNQFALSGDESHFAWWITEFSAAHIPNLEDAGIRDEVILTLKRQQARKLAEERGKVLAKLVSDGLALPEAERKSMSDSLQGQTVLGDTESAAAVVRQTQLFSWLEQESAPQMSFQQPQLRLGTINWSDESGGVLRSAGDRFMKTVFDDLGPDQTGVVADDELKSYYVVQVTDRIGDEDVLRQMFLTEGRQFGFRSGEISGLVSGLIAQPVMNDWRNTIWLKYGIDLSQMEE